MPITVGSTKLENVITAKHRVAVDGEDVVDFEVVYSNGYKSLLRTGNTFVVDGQTFDIAFVELGINNDGHYTIRVEGDHMSYRLARKDYDITDFNVSPEVDPDDPDPPTFTPITLPSAILSAIMTGTGFSASFEKPKAEAVDFSMSGTVTRRELLLKFAEFMGTEVKANNSSITLLDSKTGQTAKKVELGKNLITLTQETDARTRPDESIGQTSPIVSYRCQLTDMPGGIEYELGDDVEIVDHILGISEIKKVISVETDPNYPTEPTVIELGDFSKRQLNDVIPGMQDGEDGEGGSGVGEQGDPGPQGPPGKDGQDATLTDEEKSKIFNKENTQRIQCNPSSITIDSGEDYTLNLAGGTIGEAIVSSQDGPGKQLQFGELSRIVYSEKNQGLTAVKSSVVCSDNIVIKVGDKEYILNLVGGEAGLPLVAGTYKDSSGGEKDQIGFDKISGIAYTTVTDQGQETEHSSIVCSKEAITLKAPGKNAGDSVVYTLDLNDGQNGSPIVKTSDNRLTFGEMRKIAHTDKTSVFCQQDGILLQQEETVLKLILKDGKQGDVLSKNGTDIKFVEGPSAAMYANADLIFVTELPPVAEALPNRLYVLYE